MNCVKGETKPTFSISRNAFERYFLASAAAAATGDNSTDQITIVFSSFYNPINANYNVRLLDHLA